MLHSGGLRNHNSGFNHRFLLPVVSSLAATLAVPLSIYVLTLPLPYLPQGDGLSPFYIIGSAILVLGLALYNIPQPANKAEAAIKIATRVDTITSKLASVQTDLFHSKFSCYWVRWWCLLVVTNMINAFEIL
ncbi:hypothetical protein MRB53_010540 [Persea americana]|uniref:Uncharacterized protein n=1 Tax=Persea americana TaxID=3435 RepID=A0ACC2LSV6_PERAE|nr:hypothetical protein MRB53_010540 [Persea americana]